MRMRLRSARRATAAAMATSVAVVGLLSAACTPSTGGTKLISGTVKGADGKIVDALVGFDVIDGNGRKMDLGGGRVGYSAIQRLNHCVGTSGATRSQKCSMDGQVTGYNWSLRVPASARQVYIEVYPKAPTPTAWLNNYRGYTGVAAGTTNTSTYSTTYRRALPLSGSGRSNVAIVLPKVCGTPRGSTGALAGRIAGWPAGVTGQVNAWSLAGDQSTMGFATGRVYGNGTYSIPRPPERSALRADRQRRWLQPQRRGLPARDQQRHLHRPCLRREALRLLRSQLGGTHGPAPGTLFSARAPGRPSRRRRGGLPASHAAE